MTDVALYNTLLPLPLRGKIFILVKFDLVSARGLALESGYQISTWTLYRMGAVVVASVAACIMQSGWLHCGNYDMHIESGLQSCQVAGSACIIIC